MDAGDAREACGEGAVQADLIYGLHTVRAVLTQEPTAVLELWIQQSRTDEAVDSIENHTKDISVLIVN